MFGGLPVVPLIGNICTTGTDFVTICIICTNGINSTIGDGAIGDDICVNGTNVTNQIYDKSKPDMHNISNL